VLIVTSIRQTRLYHRREAQDPPQERRRVLHARLYAEPLRRFFQDEAWIQSVVDFGHAKQIFEEVDVFPSIIVARRPTDSPKPATARLCTIPREQLHIDDLSRQIEREGVELPLSQLTADAWQLEPGGVNSLLAKIRANGIPLRDFTGSGRYRGVTTGLNSAFLISSAVRDGIVGRDPKSAGIIKRCLRGQDVTRWCPDFAGQWLTLRDEASTLMLIPGLRSIWLRSNGSSRRNPRTGAIRTGQDGNPAISNTSLD
jgi:hypothetical protein